MHINELNEIRIIINPGPGLGHQKAAVTLMLKLRQMGFKGTFDIRYVEIHPIINETKERAAKVGAIGRVLQVLIPEFVPTLLDVENDPGHELVETRLGIGKIKISRLPNCDEGKVFYQHLPKTILSMSAADDYAEEKPAESPPGLFVKSPARYNSEMHACLQPTDWDRGDRFVYIRNKNLPVTLDSRLILTCDNPNPSIPDDNLLSTTEKRILAILNNETFLTQFIYPTESAKSRIKPQHIIPSILQAHNKNITDGKYGNKSVILFCPRSIANIISVHDLTDLELPNLKPGTVICAYTGNLSPAFFDYILHNTKFPAMLQGANSISYCEANGLPFLYFCDSGMPFEYYTFKDKGLEKTQIKHEYASQGAIDPSLYLSHLCEYLSDTINNPDEIVKYHQARAREFNARGNVVETAVNQLGFDYDRGPDSDPSTNNRRCIIS